MCALQWQWPECVHNNGNGLNVCAQQWQWPECVCFIVRVGWVHNDLNVCAQQWQWLECVRTTMAWMCAQTATTGTAAAGAAGQPVDHAELHAGRRR